MRFVFEKILDPDLEADDFQNSISFSLSTYTSLVAFSRRSNKQTDGRDNAMQAPSINITFLTVATRTASQTKSSLRGCCLHWAQGTDYHSRLNTHRRTYTSCPRRHSATSKLQQQQQQ